MNLPARRSSRCGTTGIRCSTASQRAVRLCTAQLVHKLLLLVLRCGTEAHDVACRRRRRPTGDSLLFTNYSTKLYPDASDLARLAIGETVILLTLPLHAY